MVEISKNNADIYAWMEKLGFRAYDKELRPIANGNYPSGNIFFINEGLIK